VQSPLELLKGQKILCEIAFFLFREAELEKLIVMIDHFTQRGKPPIVIETTALMRPQTF
jgi:hypothetical protein